MAKQTKGRILIVDDQENWRKVLGQLLAEYELSFASSFEEAVLALEQKRFNLAIVDVRLVDKDIFNVEGVELMKIIKRSGAQMGLIILTGYPDDIKRNMLEIYKPDDLLLKVPENERFDSDAFRKRVATLIEKYTV